jgi:hypothetical protein
MTGLNAERATQNARSVRPRRLRFVEGLCQRSNQSNLGKTSFLRFAVSFLPILFCCSFDFQEGPPPSHWYGTLTIKPMTFQLYLRHDDVSPQLFILSPKANEIRLDTSYFIKDSLRFNRSDFYTEYKGLYHSESNTIQGTWIDEDHKHYPVIFNPVDPDTLIGLKPKIGEAFEWQNPEQKSDGLRTCASSSSGINTNLLDSLTLSIMNERYPNIHSLIIAKDDCLIYEDYFYGWKPEDLWLIQSVTKSFTSALTGISLAKGEIKRLDESICNYLKKYKDKACNPQNRDITIRQLLTMSTGLDWNELEFDYYDERNTANECGRASDPFECVLSRTRSTKANPPFAYNSMNHLMVNMALRESKSMRNANELRKRLLDPLGIKDVNPGQESFGVIGDIGLTPRSMTKFGMLYLNKGMWNNKQIIPSSWVAESTSPTVSLGNGEGYGYFWWTKQFKINDQLIECYYAWGYGGQYIFVIPSANTVVAMTASNWIMDEKKYAFEMMERYIIPAVK